MLSPVELTEIMGNRPCFNAKKTEKRADIQISEV
jgi:hypothetical protein